MAGKSELVTNTDARDGLPVVRRRIVRAADVGVIQCRAAGPKLQIPTVSLDTPTKV